MTENNIVQIPLAHPVSHLNEMRRALGIPDEYTDERVLQSLVGNVIDNYMDVEHINPEEIQDDLTENCEETIWNLRYIKNKVMNKIKKLYDENNKVIRVSNGEDKIDIFQMPKYGQNIIPSWGVNWGGYGTVSTKEAGVFLTLLEVAIEAAEENNRR